MVPSFSVEALFILKFSFGLFGGLLAIAWTAFRQNEIRLAAWVDVALATLIGGTLGARLIYILLHLKNFIDFPEDIPKIWFGGLNWHGAILGGLLGASWACNYRRVDFHQFSDALALAVPCGTIAGWWACRRAGYGYGKLATTEPDWLTGFLPDAAENMALRLELQVFGIWMGFALLVIVMIFTIQERLQGQRLWWILALTGLAMFILGFGRGDPADKVLGFRLDQIFDLLLMAMSVFGLRRVSNGR